MRLFVCNLWTWHDLEVFSFLRYIYVSFKSKSFASRLTEKEIRGKMNLNGSSPHISTDCAAEYLKAFGGQHIDNLHRKTGSRRK